MWWTGQVCLPMRNEISRQCIFKRLISNQSRYPHRSKPSVSSRFLLWVSWRPQGNIPRVCSAPLGLAMGTTMCPHAVQAALDTDRMGMQSALQWMEDTVRGWESERAGRRVKKQLHALTRLLGVHDRTIVNGRKVQPIDLTSGNLFWSCYLIYCMKYWNSHLPYEWIAS